MTITAQYPGTCRKCGGGFTPGTKIDWAKGQGSAHVTCPDKPAAAPTTTNRPPAQRKRCWECGCSFTYRDAKENDGDWQDSYCGC